jgi:hypothetical protein
MGKIYGSEESHGPYGTKHQGMLIFQVEEEVEEGDYAGSRKEVRFYHTMTLGTNTYPSKIRKFVEKWRAKPFTQEEVEAGFDTEVLVGMSCRLDINHKTNKDGSRTYAVIDSISKAKSKLKAKDYVPTADRKKKNDDDDIPF